MSDTCRAKQRFTSMKATSRGRFFLSVISSGTSGTRSSFSRRLMMSIALTGRMLARSAPAVNHVFPASAGEPVRERDGEADQAAYDRPVQADELEVGADPLLDLRDQGIGLERFEMLAHREPDLTVVATH